MVTLKYNIYFQCFLSGVRLIFVAVEYLPNLHVSTFAGPYQGSDIKCKFSILSDLYSHILMLEGSFSCNDFH